LLADAVPLKARQLSITLPEKGLDEQYYEELFSLLSRGQGKCEVFLNVRIEENIKMKIYSMPLRIQGASRLEKDLRERNCEVEWVL
jgi:hypothetical protein